MTMGSEEACVIMSSCQQSHPFEQRRVCIPPDGFARIGRAVAKVQPACNNFVFDCKVLSRIHAVIWYEDGSFFIRDTKSSNGTFINSRRLSKAGEESAPYEIFSGDIVQMGVDISESCKAGGGLTHSCIVAMLRLYHPNGLEALKRDSCDSTGRASSCTSGNVVQPQEMYQIELHIKESAYRERLLESKLAALGALVASTQEATDRCWQTLIDQDRLLSRIQMLEGQLELMRKSGTEDELRNELCRLASEKADIESAAKESLHRVMMEKLDAIQRVADVECMLEACSEECFRLKANCESTQSELSQVVERHDDCLARIRELEKILEATELKNCALEIEMKMSNGKVVEEGGELNTSIVASEEHVVNQQLPPCHEKNEERLTMINGDWKSLAVNHEGIHLPLATEEMEESDLEECWLEGGASLECKYSSEAVRPEDSKVLLVARQKRIHQLQEQLACARNELQKRAVEVESLENRLKLSDKQLCHLVEQAVGDLLRRFEEVIYQKCKNEELILFLKVIEQVRQLEERFKPSLLVKETYKMSTLFFANGECSPPEAVDLYKDALETENFVPTLNEVKMNNGDDSSESYRLDGIGKLSADLPLIFNSSVGKCLLQLKDKVDNIDTGENNALANSLADVRDMLKALLCFGESTTVAPQLLLSTADQQSTNRNAEETSSDLPLFENQGVSMAEQQSSSRICKMLKVAAEFTNSKQECTTLRQRIAAIEQDMKNTRKENNELLSEYERLKHSYTSVDFERRSLLQKQRAMDQQLDMVRRKNENLAEQVTTSQKELKKVADCKALIELENVSLKAKLRDADRTKGGAVVTEDLKPTSVEQLSLLPFLPFVLIIIALAIAFYPWLVNVTFTNDDPTSSEPNTNTMHQMSA